VVALVQAFLQRVDRQKAQAAKRQKQKDLKVQAILAQVRKIAKEDQFDFATEVDSVKLKLIIRLSDKDDYFAILIPFNQFKEVLPKLRTAIQALRETYNSGVRFTTHLKRGYRRSNWTRHQDL
jgi:predicted transcriptional regulator